MKKFSSWIFLIEPFVILPNWKFALMCSPVLRPQRYESGIGWVSYEWAWFRFHYWPKEAVEWCDKMKEILHKELPDDESE
jgi:hypothetical protein